MYKIPEFYMIFARKMPEFYIIIARKIFHPNFSGARAPAAPVSYAYDTACVVSACPPVPGRLAYDPACVVSACPPVPGRLAYFGIPRMLTN